MKTIGKRFCFPALLLAFLLFVLPVPALGAAEASGAADISGESAAAETRLYTDLSGFVPSGNAEQVEAALKVTSGRLGFPVAAAVSRDFDPEDLDGEADRLREETAPDGDLLLLLILDRGDDGVTYGVYLYGEPAAQVPEETLDDLMAAFRAYYLEEANTEALVHFAGYIGDRLDPDNAGRYESEPMPDWYPEDPASFVDFHAVDPPRVVDDADMFTEAEEARITGLIREMMEKTGRDFVLFTDTSTHGLSRGVYAADFHQFNGYGKGDDYSGSVLFISMEEGNRGWWSAATGECAPYFNDWNLERIDDSIEPLMIDGQYAAAMERYLDSLTTVYLKGRIITSEDVASAIVSGGLVGLIFGLISLCVCKGTMKAPAPARNADRCVVPGSFVRRSLNEKFRYSTVSKSLRSSTSSGGSGGSYHSSGGRSYSGGGRSF